MIDMVNDSKWVVIYLVLSFFLLGKSYIIVTLIGVDADRIF